ncbi:MAG: GldG family protein [Bacteroidota bacterium]|nr:GldG family protein [Bacteroidota bacterium]
MKNTKSITSRIILIFAVIVVINVVSDKFFFRLDMTADQRYTLSKATKDILKNLNEPLTVTAYFTEDLPADLVKTRRDFKDLLVEYNNTSGGKVVYEFIDPNQDQQLEQKAIRDGVQPIRVSAREKDQVVQQKAYLGAVIQKGNQTDAIPVVQPGAAMEYTLSSTIKKMSVSVKPRIGFVTGHGEPSLASYQQALNPLNVLYQVEEVELGNTGNINDFETLVINGPRDSLAQEEFNVLDAFLAQGGKLYIAYNKVEGI